MICEMQKCQKVINEGKFIIMDAFQKTEKGNKKIKLFLVVCLQCIETNKLTEKVIGHIKV